VLLYLEKMQSDPPDAEGGEANPTSPRSQTVPARVTSPMLKGSNSGGSGARRSARSELSYVTDKRQNAPGLNGPLPTEHDNEFRSDVQEGRYSEAGASVPIRTTGHVSVVVSPIGSGNLVSGVYCFHPYLPRWSLALKMVLESDTNHSVLPLETWANPLGINK
jgi:hypothetical protein